MTSGFYIAHHRWLDIEYGPDGLHKVGHTGNLGGRLNDSAYVTCFPPDGWKYVACFETASKEDAFLLETAVLYCCRHLRLAPRELVRVSAAELVRLATDAAGMLGIRVVRRDSPEYAKPAPNKVTGAARPTAATDEEPSAWAAKRIFVEKFTLAPRVPATAVTTAFEADLAGLIDDIMTWDIKATTPPAPAPAPTTTLATTTAAKPVRTVSAPAVATKRAQSAPQEDMIMDEVEDVVLAGALDEVEKYLMGGGPLPAGAGDPAKPSPFDIAAPPVAFAARDYQRDAITLCTAELKAKGAAILQMACRCGKTPVAFGVIREFLATRPAEDGPVCALILVPGLSLLRQTAQKLVAYGATEPMLLVGSDPRPIPLGGGRELTMTTDAAVIRAFVGERGRRLVISTYQSSPQVPADAFVVSVFDEAHRVCGGRAPRPFNHFVLAPRAGARLFMTATPAYDPPSKSAITMKDRAVFGGVAFRYHLRQGIAAGHVNDFRLEVVAAPVAPTTGDRTAPSSAEEAAAPTQILAAMAKVDKLLVFCRDIAHATRLCEGLRQAPRPEGVAPFETLVAHSRMGTASGGAAGALRAFGAPGARAVLFNCRLFQEGVEIPALNAVFFAAPRHSPRDIIQSLCRPLNRVAGKPPSIIFLPVLHDPARRPEDPANLKRYASIVPFVDALLDEDPRLYEHLLDPGASPYPLDILGTHTLGLTTPKTREVLLNAVRRAVRYGASTASRPAERLLRVENVPWDRAFAEVKRVVLTCNRYPKTTDAWVVGEARVCLHRFYRWAADEFAAWRAGKPTKLEPHQIHDLLSLPLWEPYGVEGPYPWKLCMAFLEQWLREHGGVPPMCNINVGGYVGLEATAMERLSGALTCVNQADGKTRKNGAPGSGYTLNAEKQADLERVCKPYGLRWKKDRDEHGNPVKDGPQTFIQESYDRFKAYYKANGSEGDYIQLWFPGYPRKHLRMENLEVQEKGLAPPRWRQGRKKKTDATDDKDGEGP